MSADPEIPPLHAVLRCSEAHALRARYVLDTLCMAIGVRIDYVDAPPLQGPWVLYSESKREPLPYERCTAILYVSEAWRDFEWGADITIEQKAPGLVAVFPQSDPSFSGPNDIPFDILANSFVFLSSRLERSETTVQNSRHHFAASIFERLTLPQDIVDRFADHFLKVISHLFDHLGLTLRRNVSWCQDADFAVVMSHDVDFVPSGRLDNIAQGTRTFLRHLIRQRDPIDAIRAGARFASSMLAGHDPYGCIPHIIAEETARGVRSSFQVAVANRHPADVNYDVRDDRTRNYLRAITDAGFDLCLHGSYRSTERREWYLEEVALLSERLGRPLGSRQHFLSFNYDALFTAQEEAGIQYDMSMGFPDQCGPRAGFSYPYFPFDLESNRPYDVVEISLFYMDVTLRSYMGLKPDAAREVLDEGLQELKRKRGAVSIVWHPIVFGGARDPGYDKLYWYLVDRVRELGGLATDGRTINDLWRQRARQYASFAHTSSGRGAGTS